MYHAFVCIHSITKILLLTSYNEPILTFARDIRRSIAFNLFNVIVRIAFVEDISEVRHT